MEKLLDEEGNPHLLRQHEVLWSSVADPEPVLRSRNYLFQAPPLSFLLALAPASSPPKKTGSVTWLLTDLGGVGG